MYRLVLTEENVVLLNAARTIALAYLKGLKNETEAAGQASVSEQPEKCKQQIINAEKLLQLLTEIEKGMLIQDRDFESFKGYCATNALELQNFFNAFTYFSFDENIQSRLINCKYVDLRKEDIKALQLEAQLQLINLLTAGYRKLSPVQREVISLKNNFLQMKTKFDTALKKKLPPEQVERIRKEYQKTSVALNALQVKQKKLTQTMAFLAQVNSAIKPAGICVVIQEQAFERLAAQVRNCSELQKVSHFLQRFENVAMLRTQPQQTATSALIVEISPLVERLDTYFPDSLRQNDVSGQYSPKFKKIFHQRYAPYFDIMKGEKENQSPQAKPADLSSSVGHEPSQTQLMRGMPL